MLRFSPSGVGPPQSAGRDLVTVAVESPGDL